MYHTHIYSLEKNNKPKTKTKMGLVGGGEGGGGRWGEEGGGNITRTVSSWCTAFSVLMKPFVVMTIVVSDGCP